MTPQTSLELKGNLVTHSAAELTSEIVRSGLVGSLRLEHKERKAVLYFSPGVLAFAVSNGRGARLFDILLKRGRITSEALREIPNFANDLEFAAYLEAHEIVTRKEIDDLVRSQVTSIMIDVFSWIDGSWTFSPLSRVKDGLNLRIDVLPVLLQYGRCLTVGMLLKRMRVRDEQFSVSKSDGKSHVLLRDEETVLSALSDTTSNIQDFLTMSNMNEDAAVRSIYACWLAGLLERQNWHPAFPVSAVTALKGAHLELKQEASRLQFSAPANEVAPVVSEDAADEKPTDSTISVEDYLARVEGAVTLYDVLGVDPRAEQTAIKHAYLSLAKLFHPDHFHKQSNGLATRVQTAFAELSKAHETLKTAEARELYDFRVRKEIAEKGKLADAGVDRSAVERRRQAVDNFDQGQRLLQNGDWENAIEFLARAAHFDPKNSEYRAEYGRALARDPKEKHKAEAEMQAAINFAPHQPRYRVLLAQFFIDMNLKKRAEGELGRMLKTFPGNHDALAMLERIQ